MSTEEKQKYRSEEKPCSTTSPCPCQCPGKCTQKLANSSSGTSCKPRKKRCGTKSRSSSRRSSRSSSSSRSCKSKRSRVRSSSRSSCRSGSRNRRRRALRCRSSGSGRCPSCGSTNRSQRVKRMRLGRVTNNAYLNFLRSFRRTHYGLPPQEIIRRGARKWCSLTPEQRKPYYRMARRVSRNRMRNGN